MATKIQTTERYTALWNKIKANNVNMADIDNMTPKEFYDAIGSKAKSDATYRLAKSLGRNTERQEDVNKYIDDKKIPSIIIPKIKVKEYIEPVKKKKGLDFSNNQSGANDQDDEDDDQQESESEEDYVPEDPPDNYLTLDPGYERLRVYLQDYFPTRKDAGKDVEKAFKKEIKNWDSLAPDTRRGLITDWTNFIRGSDKGT